MSDNHLIEQARKLADDRAIPPEVSTSLLWALAVDQHHRMKSMGSDLAALKMKAGLWGAGSGLLVALSAYLLSRI